jgi:TolB-like protein
MLRIFPYRAQKNVVYRRNVTRKFFYPKLFITPRHPWRGDFILLFNVKESCGFTTVDIILYLLYILYIERRNFMKKFLLIFIFSLILAGRLPAQQMNIDTVIDRAARAVEEVLPQGAKVAVLNFMSISETFSDYVIEELTGKLVTGRKITIVDRRNLALISQEMNLQLSGDVSDESAQAIGRMLGAQSIVSGTLTNMGTFYRFRVKVINVETVAIQTQASFDLQNDSRVAFLLSGNATGLQPTQSGEPSLSIEGTTVPGSNLSEKLAWLQRSADSHNTYILEVTSNENIAPHTFEYRGAINITIVLKGIGANRNIRLRSHGAMFIVNPNVTLILDNNITIQGHSGNERAMIVLEGGTLKMNNGLTITGNTNTNSNRSGSGVAINSGNFTMSGGTISGNTASNVGGGVYLHTNNATFIMSGGTISGNKAPNGGGVYINNGTFTMNGGTITGNTASKNGGGVYISSSGYLAKVVELSQVIQTTKVTVMQ